MATSEWGMGPEVSYPGGKNGAGVFQTLINLMPPHDLFVEPFLGSGAIMRAKRPAAVNIGVDVDAGVIDRASLEWKRRAGIFEFYRKDAIEYLQSAEFGTSSLIYADPPYLRSTRATSRDLYAHEMTDSQHVELLRVLKGLRCRVMISGYSSTLYAKELKGWNATAFQAATRGRPAAEWVWFNYDKPTELHDWSFFGSNFRERDHFKRMKKRWIAKLQKMSPVKRQCLLAAIAATAGNGVGDRHGRSGDAAAQK